MTDSQRWMVFVGIIIAALLVYVLSPVLIPFVISFLLAYFLDPVVTRLQRFHVPRIVSAFVVFILAVIVIVGLCLILIPSLEAQLVRLVTNLPHIIDWVSQNVLPRISSWFAAAGGNFSAESARDMLLQHIQSGGGLVKAVFTTVAHSGYTIMEVLLNIIMIPVVTIYLMYDWEKVRTQGKLYIPLSAQRRETMLSLLSECGDRLAGFIRGQLLVMIGLAFVYSLGLSIVGLDVALLVGVMSGILSVVPYLGFITGIVVALIAAAVQFHSWYYIIGVLIVYAIGEVCESLVFSPWFVGDRIGLHPVAVIFAVLVGGRLFGFVGVLLALPVSAVLMVFFRHLCRKYFPSDAKGEQV